MYEYPVSTMDFISVTDSVDKVRCYSSLLLPRSMQTVKLDQSGQYWCHYEESAKSLIVAVSTELLSKILFGRMMRKRESGVQR